METTIASLEEELGAANQEKEEIYARNESMSSELEMLSDKLDISNTELNALQEEISDLVSSHCLFSLSALFLESLAFCLCKLMFS